MRGGARVPQALAHLRERALPGQTGHQVKFADPHRQQRDDDGQEADRVQVEARGDADGGDDNCTDRRADDASRVELGGVESDGIGEVLGAHHLGDERLAGRAFHRVDHAANEGEPVDDADRDEFGGGEHGEDESNDELTHLAVDHRPAFSHPVGEHPAVEGEEQGRKEADGHGQTQRYRRVGEAQHQPAEGEILHPGAGQGDELAAPEEPVVAVAQRAEGMEEATSSPRIIPGARAPRGRRAGAAQVAGTPSARGSAPRLGAEPGHLVAHERRQYGRGSVAKRLHALPLFQDLTDIRDLDAGRRDRLDKSLAPRRARRRSAGCPTR